MQEKILLVDDDELLLAGLRRTLGRRYDLVTVADAQAGLDLVAANPFAVIVSDLRMPNMDGIAFLTKAREISPNSIRMMLTSHADVKVAINAINESHIFRFLVKPVAGPVMVSALEAGIAQYRLVMAERELLSKTLLGSVHILTNLLHRVYPEVVQLTSRIRKRTRLIAEQLQLPDIWQYELAAMLSPIGLIAAPAPLLSKLQAGEHLTTKEQDALAEYMASGRDLLINIPRLETVAEIIGKQQQTFFRSMYRIQPKDRDVTLVGAQILQIATHFERLYSKYSSEQSTLLELYRIDNYDPFILDALRATLATKPS
jgi:response regulator RpfG family c-di-GMP phosphodiesterase